MLGTDVTGMTATGGLINDYTSGSAIYRAHIFTSSGTFNVTALGTNSPTSDKVEYLVVAGGGSGATPSGGGGAGGLRTSLPGHPLAGSPLPISTSPGAYTVTVGAGGALVTDASPAQGSNGNNSVFGSITSHGGGGGGRRDQQPGWGGKDGGSGGGGSATSSSFPAPGSFPSAGGSGNTPPASPPQGNPGGAGNTGSGPGNTLAAGGGGGAGAAGGDGTTGASGAGGAGVQVAIAGPAADTTGVGALNPGPGQYQWFAGGGGGGGADAGNSQPGSVLLELVV